MNIFKSNGGFTLVELIVVIAILAILAGVAVPVYSSYIQNANESVDNQTLEGVNTAIASAMAMEGLDVTEASTYFTVGTVANGKVSISPAKTNDTIVNQDVWDNFCNFYKGSKADTVEIAIKYFTAVEVNSNGELVEKTTNEG